MYTFKVFTIAGERIESFRSLYSARRWRSYYATELGIPVSTIKLL